jgi:hypothetical protein
MHTEAALRQNVQWGLGSGAKLAAIMLSSCGLIRPVTPAVVSAVSQSGVDMGLGTHVTGVLLGEGVMCNYMMFCERGLRPRSLAPAYFKIKRWDRECTHAIPLTLQTLLVVCISAMSCKDIISVYADLIQHSARSCCAQADPLSQILLELIL